MHRQISDISLAAYLMSIHRMVGIVKKPGSEHVYFLFEPTGEVERSVQDYLNDTAIVGPRQFIDRVKHLRGAVRDAKAEGQKEKESADGKDRE